MTPPFRGVISRACSPSAARRRSSRTRRGPGSRRPPDPRARRRRGGRGVLEDVRAQFVMPPDLAVMNAANLCPASRPVVEALTRETRSVDYDPSPKNRARLMPEKEQTRKVLAEFLRVTPDEIVITRNTSESNNLVSNGLDLKAGDEVVVHADNHPSNLNAWNEKAKRFGFTVVTVSRRTRIPAWTTTSTPTRGRSRRARRCSRSRTFRAPSAT